MSNRAVLILLLVVIGVVALDAMLGTGMALAVAREFTAFLGWLAFWR